MKKVTSQWLEETGAEFERQGIDSNERADLAEKKYRKEFVAEPKNSDDFQQQWNHLNAEILKIHSHFLTQTNRDRGYIRLQFTGIYYFHGDFWEVMVPIVMGQRSVHPFKYLRMPLELQQLLASDEERVSEYAGVYADTLDYGYAIEEVERRCPDAFSRELFRNADKHLRATISLLFPQVTSSKAVEDARMAVEIFLKAFIVVKEGLADADLKSQLGHKLDMLVDRCIAHGMTDLVPLRDRILKLPGVEARYESKERTFGDLWGAYRLALAAGVAALRHLTKRDSRAGFRVQS